MSNKGNGKFVPSSEAPREEFDWGTFAWISRPALSGAKDLVVTAVDIVPGAGHNFHKHPDQEEVIYVIEGQLEQWLETEKRVLSAGDSVFIPRDTVHASFTMGGQPARALAILGPAVGDAGYDIVDVSGEEPWCGLRG